ncbi:MAG: hypothetical protein MJ171_02295, partial [Clostridia bacterium]|nr:hypothetical protein [Clostridia bacterium]
FDFSVSGFGELTSISVSVSTSNCTVKSGSWTLGGTTMANFNGSSQGVAAFAEPKSVSGKAFKLTVAAGSVGTGSVTVTFQAKNGASGLGSASTTKTFTIGCATHDFKEEKTEPTCTKAGKIKKTCSVCGTVEETEIKALGHKVPDYQTTKEPTCTETGSKEGTCSVCNEKVTQSIPAKGHKVGAFTPVSAGDCSHKGTESAVCSVCGETVTQETDFGEHQFADPELVQEATLTKPSIHRGKCTVCGEETEQYGPCKASDETTGISFETQEGTFVVGTALDVKALEETDEAYQNAQYSLDGISSKFNMFNFDANMAGVPVEANGVTSVTFPIPEEFGKNVAIYHILEDGSIESMGGKISADGTTITTKVTEMGNYALCYLNGGAQEKSGGNIFLYTTIGEGVLILILLLLLLLKRKKKEEM